MKELTRDELIRLSILLRQADKLGSVYFSWGKRLDKAAYCAFFADSNYAVVAHFQPGFGVTLGVGRLDAVCHTSIVGEFPLMGIESFPEFTSFCEWLKKRAEEPGNEPCAASYGDEDSAEYDVPTKELITLIER